MRIFRQGLLEGRSIALAGAIADPVKNALAALGARVQRLDGPSAAAPLDALVCAALPNEHLVGDALLEQEWAAVQAVASELFIPARAGRIILIAPRRDAGTVKAGVENLARTLSVEWARYGITTTAITPGPKATDDQLAMLVAYLCSPAGAYFSGCRFDLG